MAEEIFFRTARELADDLDAGRLSSEELARIFLRRIDEVEPRVQSFLSLDEEDILRQAIESDRRRAAKQPLGPLDGIPVGIKDNLAVKDQPLTCASRMLEGYRSPYDSTVIDRLRRAGMVIFGRLNMDEFAMGSSTETSAFHPTRNPWDLERVPGGSSGGSASSLAAGEMVLSLGTDTGGSVRQPASFCGVCGLKPTYGRVSRYGVTAFASSLDQVGPMGRSVDDVAMLLGAMAGWDARDATSVHLEVPDYLSEAQRPGPWKIGVVPEFFGEGIDGDVLESVQGAVDFYRSKGCEILPVHLPHASLGIAVYYIIATAEASSNLARFDGIRYGHRSAAAKDAIDIYCRSRGEGFGDEVKRRIILGTAVLSSGCHDAYYTQAQCVRSLIRRDYEEAFQRVDALLLPTTTTAAFTFGGRVQSPLAMYLNDVCTVSANLAGVPAISIPCGFSQEGLPIGLQLVGKPYGEGDLLAIANCFEKGHDFHWHHPKL